MKILFLLLILTLGLATVKAQKFERAVGIRLGHSSGIYYDVEKEDLSTLRFMITFREGGDQFIAMKYFHNYSFDKLPENFSIYYGYGIHAGYTKWEQYIQNEEHGYYWEKISAPVIGLDGLIGVSYDFRRIPLSITCDLKPYFDFWGKNIFKAVPLDFAFGVNYSF
ncbi:MAG: hypothetical protein JW798_00775 [Prolixibacteraceae bacterium]|nr:hypothetical protein [Prolixibacteraceae bacterium]